MPINFETFNHIGNQMSNYERKTIDTWQIWTNYGYGWEHETTEISRKECKENVKAYYANCPGIQIKIKRKREPKA